MSDYVCREIKKTHNLIHRVLEGRNKNSSDNNLTFPDRQVCRYLFCNDDKPIYQKDVEKTFSLRRSSASTQLSKMEEKGLIVRVSEDSDKRLKRIVLTQKAKEIMASSCKEMEAIEELIVKGLTKAEITSLLKTLDKMQSNLISETEKSNGEKG